MGWSCCDAFAWSKSASELPVIMVTGRDSSGDVVQALRLGASDYVTKPVDFEVALARLNTHLEWRRAQFELKERMRRLERLAEELQVRNQFIKQVFGRYVDRCGRSERPGGPQRPRIGWSPADRDGADERFARVYKIGRAIAPGKSGRVAERLSGIAMADVIGRTPWLGRRIHRGCRPGHLRCATGPVRSRRTGRGLRAGHAGGHGTGQSPLGRLGLAALEMGIGVNTGEVVVGNIGSDKRTKYDVVGAQVNLTARIQAVTVGRRGPYFRSDRRGARAETESRNRLLQS